MVSTVLSRLGPFLYETTPSHRIDSAGIGRCHPVPTALGASNAPITTAEANAVAIFQQGEKCYDGGDEAEALIELIPILQ